LNMKYKDKILISEAQPEFKNTKKRKSLERSLILTPKSVINGNSNTINFSFKTWKGMQAS